METIFEISTDNGQLYYDFFYFLAIVCAGIFFMRDGIQKKYPLTEWSLVFTTGIFFLIAGTKLITYTSSEWHQVFTSFVFPYTEKKSILGGIIGFIIGVCLAKKILHIPFSVLDSFAVGFPFAMGIQRIGCLMAGCCAGAPTELPWAISYSSGFFPYHTHLSQGLINQTATTSLPVHPVQIYQTVLCMLIALVVWKLRKLFKSPGNLFFTAIALYGVVRFFIEFWCEVSLGSNIVVWMGLKSVQWLLIVAIVLLFTVIFIRERMVRRENKIVLSRIHSVWYLLVLCLLVFIGRHWFTKTEFLFVELLLVQSVFLQINKILSSQTTGGGYRIASLCASFIVLISGVRITAQDTASMNQPNDDSRSSFNEVGVGYGRLQYTHYHTPPVYVPGTPAQGCNNPGTPATYIPGGAVFSHHSNVLGAGITHTETYGKYRKLTLKGEFSGGYDYNESDTGKQVMKIYDIAPSFKFDGRWIGFGLGFHSGSNMGDEQLRGMYYTSTHVSRKYDLFSGRFRLFPEDIIYLEFRYNQYFPYQIGHRTNELFQGVLGTCFGLTNGSRLEIGYDGNGGTFISASALLYKHYGLKASLYLCDKQDNTIRQFMQFSVSYRFSEKHWISQYAAK